MSTRQAAAPGFAGNAMRVDTIAALRAFSPEMAQVVEVAGYHVPDDGGGGRFMWVADHGEPENCGTVIAPSRAATGNGRWLRDANETLELAWFGAVGDGQTDDTEALDRALGCAVRTGRPLTLGPGTYHIASDVTAEIGAGQTLEVRGVGATIRRRGPGGTLFLDAEEVARIPVVETIEPGGDGITLADTAQVQVGDLVAVATGIRLAKDNASSWTATEYGQVVAIRGNRLILDGPTLNRAHPDRRLAYRMDGRTDQVHYRLFWGAEADEIRVALDGVMLTPGTDYAVSGRVNRGYDVKLTRTPAAGSEVTLTTADPIHARIFRGGTLSLTDLRFEADFKEAGPVAFIDGHGLAPANSQFRNLELLEDNAPLDENGYRRGVEGDLFRLGLVNSLVDTVRIKGGRYAMMALSGRNTTYRNITAEGCWHAVSSFGANTVHIENVVAIRCYAAIDSHYAQIQRVDGVEGVDCWDGMNHRANGGSVRNAVLVDNLSPRINGMNFGVAQGSPLDDRMVVDPRDNPRNQFSNGRAEFVVADCRFAAPNDPDGFGLFGSYLHRATFRNVETDGPLVVDGAGPSPLRELILDRFDCRLLELRGVTELVSAKQVRTGQLNLRGCSAPLIRFDGCVFDGTRAAAAALILDGEIDGARECRFVNCTFRKAGRLLDSDGAPTRHYTFVNCVFEVDDTGGYG